MVILPEGSWQPVAEIYCIKVFKIPGVSYLVTMWLDTDFMNGFIPNTRS